MVALVSRKDATKEKYIINKEEEESTCLMGSEIKKSYTRALKDIFTKGGERKEMDYLQSKLYFSIQGK